MEQSWNSLDLLCLGFAGILLHILIKINTINRQMLGGFKYRDFLRLEWPSIMISIVTVLVAVFLRREIEQSEYATKYMGAVFFAVGILAQLIVYKFIGRAQSIIDSKKEDDKENSDNTKTDNNGPV